jgi:hypothetical protein
MSLRVTESFTPVKSGSDKKTSQWPWTAKLLGQAVKKGIQEGKTQEEPKIFMCEPCNSLPHFTLLSPLPCCTGPRTPGSLPSPPSFLPPLHPRVRASGSPPGSGTGSREIFREKEGRPGLAEPVPGNSRSPRCGLCVAAAWWGRKGKLASVSSTFSRSTPASSWSSPVLGSLLFT